MNWVFTVPGSWPEFPTVADFKCIALNALNQLPGDGNARQVTVDIKEAGAAAQFLTKFASKKTTQG